VDTAPSSSVHVFVSRPTVIGPLFEAAYDVFHDFVSGHGFKLRRLGRSDYSRKAPLQAVMDIIDECCGAIVLGYPQLEFHHEVRRGSQVQNSVGYTFATPWNQIEGALAYRRRAPVIIAVQDGISGGVFDHGVTGEGVLHLDLSKPDWFQQDQFAQPYREWLTDVRNCFQQRPPIT
jgi:hypothetical protein